jgi:pimeloyl-ACP methyl ester carboxylesterase
MIAFTPDTALPRETSQVLVTDDGAQLWLLRRPQPGSDGTVVLVHGWGASRDMWRPVADGLERLGRPVVIYDLRGHGASRLGAEPFSIDRLGRDLAAVLEYLDLRDVVLVGHSGGGYSALSYLIDHASAPTERVRQLVLLATAAHGQKVPPPERLMMGSGVLTRMLSSPKIGAKILSHTTGPNCPAAELDQVRRMFAATPKAVRRAAFSSTTRMDLRRGLSKLHLPAIVLAGEHDRVVEPRFGEELAAALPAATFESIPGAGHMLPLETPELLVERIHQVADALG